MQTLSRQAVCRLLRAFTQGLHAIPAHKTWLRGVGAPKSAGVSGPKSVTASIEVRVAKCAGPLSLVTKTSAKVKAGDLLQIELRPTPQSQAFKPETMDLDVVFEDVERGAAGGLP